jgi:hypothetical protein
MARIDPFYKISTKMNWIFNFFLVHYAKVPEKGNHSRQFVECPSNLGFALVD